MKPADHQATYPRRKTCQSIGRDFCTLYGGRRSVIECWGDSEVIRSWWKFLSDPSHEMWIGLIVAFLFAGLALLGLIRLHSTSRTILPLGSSGIGGSQINQEAPLKDYARLSLAFDNNGQASLVQQDGVRSYHWYSIPGVKVDWSSQNVDTEALGYVLIFLEFTDPTHTENWRILVDGRSTDDARVMTTTATAATVRAVGDMHGKTVDIRFSKDRILDQ